MSLVQHNNQYELVHHACLEYAERALREIQYVDTLPDLQPVDAPVHVCMSLVDARADSPNRLYWKGIKMMCTVMTTRKHRIMTQTTTLETVRSRCSCSRLTVVVVLEPTEFETNDDDEVLDFSRMMPSIKGKIVLSTEDLPPPIPSKSTDVAPSLPAKSSDTTPPPIPIKASSPSKLTSDPGLPGEQLDYTLPQYRDLKYAPWLEPRSH